MWSWSARPNWFISVFSVLSSLMMGMYYLVLFSHEDRVEQHEPKLNKTVKKVMTTTASPIEIGAVCNETIAIVNKVYIEKNQINNSEKSYWSQDVPSIFLDCNQLSRSLQRTAISRDSTENDVYEITPTISLMRLAKKMKKLDLSDETSDPLKIVVIGGSMTAGAVNVGNLRNRKIAWPYKLSNFMREKWPQKQIEIINLARGGANEETWLGNLDMIVDQSPIDIILVDSAVNNQCPYDKQDSKAEETNRTSSLLLNILTKSFNEAAVFSVELFRTSYNNKEDANRFCKDHVKQLFDPSSNQTCYWCPQWWKPQDWRVSARNANSVSYISYRDAVWDDYDNPPVHLCQYWTGLSHPQAGVHTMVASTVLFQFLLVNSKLDSWLQSIYGVEQEVESGFAASDDYICLNPASSFHARQGVPVDPMDFKTAASNNSSCWDFRADSKEKYGWICQVDQASAASNKNISYRLQKNINTGNQRLVIVERLVSYDDRMAVAQVWFTSPHSSNSNAFVGDPVWNISSSHNDTTSIPKPHPISLNEMELKPGIHRRHVGKSELIFNIKMLIGSSKSSIQHSKDRLGTDKFKLLGIVAC